MVAAVLGLAPLLLAGLYLMPVAHTDPLASAQPQGAGAVLLRALPCLGVGMSIALIGSIALRAFDRGGSRALVLLASAGGVAANLLLLLHCPLTAPAHLLLGHLGVLLLVVAGALLLARTARG